MRMSRIFYAGKGLILYSEIYGKVYILYSEIYGKVYILYSKLYGKVYMLRIFNTKQQKKPRDVGLFHVLAVFCFICFLLSNICAALRLCLRIPSPDNFPKQPCVLCVFHTRSSVPTLCRVRFFEPFCKSCVQVP